MGYERGNRIGFKDGCGDLRQVSIALARNCAGVDGAQCELDCSHESSVHVAVGGRSAIENMVRHCGWGEPDLDAAMSSGADSLTLIAQGALQPFERTETRTVRARDMQLHSLPWPREQLLALGELTVELQVTLSYFVEPNPGERGLDSRYSYASHGLRFAVQKSTETQATFRRRVNRLARDDDEGIEPAGGAVPAGCLELESDFVALSHHDRWSGTAAELATREHIAVYPVGGWWKTRPGQERYDRAARYALVVSIRAPALPNHVDLYTAVEQAIVASAGVPVVIEA